MMTEILHLSVIYGVVSHNETLISDCPVFLVLISMGSSKRSPVAFLYSQTQAAPYRADHANLF